MAAAADPATWTVPAIQAIQNRNEMRFLSTMPGQPAVYCDFGPAIAPGSLNISRGHWVYILNQAQLHAPATPDAAV